MYQFIRSNPRTATPEKFLFGDSSWGYDKSCGWKEGLGWGTDPRVCGWCEEVSEKGSVKHTKV